MNMDRHQLFLRIMSAFAAGAGQPLPQRPADVSLRGIWPMLGESKNAVRAKTRRNKRRAKRKESARIAARLRKARVIR
jgi:hypothetical protein